MTKLAAGGEPGRLTKGAREFAFLMLARKGEVAGTRELRYIFARHSNNNGVSAQKDAASVRRRTNLSG